MPEVAYEVIAMDVQYLCDQCSNEMRSKAVVARDHHGLTYLHVCKNGHETVLGEQYPKIEYQRVTETNG